MAEQTTLDVRRVPLLDVVVGRHRVRGPEEDPDLVDLAEDIKRRGLINPLTVREMDEGLVLVAGHRRYAACRMAGVVEVLVQVVRVDEAGAAGIVFAENFHRRDVSAIEQAAAIKDAIEQGGLSADEVGVTLGRSGRWVSEQLSLLEWPEDVQFAIHRRRISVAAASYLRQITDDAYRQYLLELAVDGGASARTCMAWLEGWRAQMPPEQAGQLEAAPNDNVPLRPSPQAPCLGCGDVKQADGLAAVLLCPSCVAAMREAQRRLA